MRWSGSGNLKAPKCATATIPKATYSSSDRRTEVRSSQYLLIHLLILGDHRSALQLRGRDHFGRHGLLVLFQLEHESVAGSPVLELPQLVLHAFEDQRIDRKLNALAHRKRRRRVLGKADVGLEQLVDRSEQETGAGDIDRIDGLGRGHR